MIADAERFDAYSKAIAKAVRPGDRLFWRLVVGLAFSPCRPAALALKKFMPSIRKRSCTSRESLPPQTVSSSAWGSSKPIRVNCNCRNALDIIVSDIRGSLPLFGHAIASIEDARQRLLAPGGRLIPQRDTLKAAVIEASEFYSKLVSPWSHSSAGLDCRPRYRFC